LAAHGRRRLNRHASSDRIAFLVNLANRELSALDTFRAGKRLAGEAEPMANLETFRRRFLDDKYSAEGEIAAVRDTVVKLPAADAVDLLAGRAREQIRRACSFPQDAGSRHFSHAPPFPFQHCRRASIQCPARKPLANTIAPSAANKICAVESGPRRRSI
jgi:hypothetical protein